MYKTGIRRLLKVKGGKAGRPDEDLRNKEKHHEHPGYCFISYIPVLALKSPNLKYQ